MKALGLLALCLVLDLVILGMADWLGFNIKFPRGAVLTWIIFFGVAMVYVFNAFLDEVFK